MNLMMIVPMEVMMTRRIVDDPAALLCAAMRDDFGLFLRKAFPALAGGALLAWNWHLDAIACQLNRIETGDSSRLLVTMPPRNLKSIMISVAWVAWMLGRDPSLNFVCVSYSGELAQKLARDCRMLMQSSWYNELFPGTVISKARSAAYDFETTRGGGRLATSIMGTLTGRGGDIIIIDDPIKPDDANSETVRKSVNDWFSTTLASRLNDKENGAIICVMQRLHEQDLAGMLMEQGGWAHLSLPAIATEDATIALTRGRVHVRRINDVLHPERESRETLERLRASLGSVIFSAQYQQQPVPAQGNMAKAEWLRSVVQFATTSSGQVVQSWDTASKDGIHNDWSVCVTAYVHRGEFRILDVFRARLDFVGLKAAAIRLAREHKTDVLLIEDAASGTQLHQTLCNENPHGVPRPISRKPEGDKVTRFAAICPMMEAGQLLLPKEAPWLAEFTAEILGFPNARHDDQADALAQLMIWAARQQRFDEPGIPPIIIEPDNDIDEGLTERDPFDSEWRIEADVGSLYDWLLDDDEDDIP